MRLALDTNRYVDLCRGDAAVVDAVAHAEAVYLPFVVLAELRAGFAFGTERRANARTLDRFLSKPGVEVLYAGDETTRHYAGLYRQLREQGTPIPTNDLWIGALVVQHGLTLYSRDAHFRHLAQLDLLD